jgi:methyl coenzyme M reductase subunit C
MDHAMNEVTPVWYFNAEKHSIAVKHFNAVKHFIVMKCREVTVICARLRG